MVKPQNQPRPIAWIRDGDCIRCTSHKVDNTGYPRLRRNRTRETVARMILVRRLGCIPIGMVARHTCDHRWCIRPDHIIMGTLEQNNADRKERGGYDGVRGENSVVAKLTDSQVRQILEATGTHKSIAERFGVTESNVQNIRKRRTWRHI